MASRYTLFLLLFILPVISFASKPIKITRKHDAGLFKGEYLDYLEDSTNQINIHDILAGRLKNGFKKGRGEIIESNRNVFSTYWLHLKVVNHHPEVHFLTIELFDFRIENYHIYEISDHHIIKADSGGADFPFYHKPLRHKNFIHQISVDSYRTYDIYFKIKSSHPVSFIGTVRTFERLLQYSNSEYFLLAIFYGAILALAFYNLFIFFAVKDKAYLFYVFYVLSVGIYSLTQDGLGFQYLWFSFPVVNEFIFQLSGYFIVFWLTLYSRKFLQIDQYSPKTDKIIIAVLFMRFLIMIYTLNHLEFNTRWIDLFILLFIYMEGLYLWFIGKRAARFFNTGFTIFFVGYLLTLLLIYNLIVTSTYLVYSFNIGVICEMLLFSFALADKIKILNEDNIATQKKLLAQATENETFIQNINKELESKVLERTKLLEHKNMELDTFVYRSSHDIKGPIKTMIGLSSLALLEVQDHSVAREFFERLLECSKKLDNVNSHLLSLIDFKRIEIVASPVDFQSIVVTALQPLEENPKFHFIKKNFSFNQEGDFYSDASILRTIIKDILENAMIFANPDHKESFLNINIAVNNGEAKLHIYSTGYGIPQKVIDDMFNPFSSIAYHHGNTNNSNSLGLYLLKLHVERINGSFNFYSTVGEGAGFEMVFKSLSL